MQALVLVGGRGTRLLPLTETVPMASRTVAFQEKVLTEAVYAGMGVYL